MQSPFASQSFNVSIEKRQKNDVFLWIYLHKALHVCKRKESKSDDKAKETKAEHMQRKLKTSFDTDFIRQTFTMLNISFKA